MLPVPPPLIGLLGPDLVYAPGVGAIINISSASGLANQWKAIGAVHSGTAQSAAALSSQSHRAPPVPLTDSAAAACEQAMVYSVSKAALISLTKSEAIDLAPSGIRVRAPRPRSC